MHHFSDSATPTFSAYVRSKATGLPGYTGTVCESIYRSKVSAGIIGHLRMIRYSYTHRKLLRSNFKL